MVHRAGGTLLRRDNAGLLSQLREAALSIPANIAEGAGRATGKDFAKFVQIAVALSTEFEYHLEFAVDAKIIDRPEFTSWQREVIEMRRMLVGLVRRVRRPDR